MNEGKSYLSKLNHDNQSSYSANSISNSKSRLIFSVSCHHMPIPTSQPATADQSTGPSSPSSNPNDPASSSSRSMPSAPKFSILPMRTRKTPKLTLVLDLDETLVHSEMVPTFTPDSIFKISLNSELYNIYVYYRPGLIGFLNSVCNIFEVVIFTASMKPYAEQVLKALDPYNRLKYRFYRDCCTEMDGNYVKDLRVLGRDLSKVIIIDNSDISFSFQPENGILIKSWFNDQTDRELETIQQFLMSLAGCEDVRPALRKKINSLNTIIDLII